jgi:catechol 2,3-dioxygenase-like lactoylglutathione lyase family enzyme
LRSNASSSRAIAVTLAPDLAEIRHERRTSPKIPRTPPLSLPHSMIDHIEIAPAHMAESLPSMPDALGPLGYSRRSTAPPRVSATARSICSWSRAKPVRRAFRLRRAGPRDGDRIYEAARAAGLTLDRAPALAPHIHPNYYAGYLRDPDGRLIEFVCHAAEPAN